MATASPHADRTASEARRPEAGSRAGGVSRAERGNDGSPEGARRRRRLDALRARQRDRPSPRWPGTPSSLGIAEFVFGRFFADNVGKALSA